MVPGRIIPDGQGGVVTTWTISPFSLPVQQPWHYYQAAHVVSDSVVASYDLPFLPFRPVLNRYPTMVLSENGTAFVTDGWDPDNGPQIVSFSLASGAVNWSYQASAGSVLSIIAATEGGDIVAKITQGSDTIIRFFRQCRDCVLKEDWSQFDKHFGGIWRTFRRCPDGVEYRVRQWQLARSAQRYRCRSTKLGPPIRRS